MNVPPALDWWRAEPGGAEWLAALAASVLRDRRWELGQPGDAARIRRRLDVLTDELGLDGERMRRWSIAHALAWGVSATKVEEDMIECARLLVAAT